jgi:hypothetical protein
MQQTGCFVQLILHFGSAGDLNHCRRGDGGRFGGSVREAIAVGNDYWLPPCPPEAEGMPRHSPALTTSGAFAPRSRSCHGWEAVLWHAERKRNGIPGNIDDQDAHCPFLPPFIPLNSSSKL